MNDTHKYIKVAQDFSDSLGGRSKVSGPFSGQAFYEKFLNKYLTELWDTPNSSIVIDFDGTMTPAPSFLSEIITLMVRDFVDIDKLKRIINIKSDDNPLLIHDIEQIFELARNNEN